MNALVYLKGGFEFSLFMPSAAKHFENVSVRTAFWSCLVPIVQLPYGIYGITLTHGTDFYILAELGNYNRLDIQTFISLFIAQSVFLYLFIFGLFYAFAKTMDRGHHFISYVMAANWASLPVNLVTLPILLMILFGSGEHWLNVYHATAIYIFYGVAVTGLIIKSSLQLPWELAAALAIMTLALSEVCKDIIHLLI